LNPSSRDRIPMDPTLTGLNSDTSGNLWSQVATKYTKNYFQPGLESVWNGILKCNPLDHPDSLMWARNLISWCARNLSQSHLIPWLYHLFSTFYSGNILFKIFYNQLNDFFNSLNPFRWSTSFMAFSFKSYWPLLPLGTNKHSFPFKQ